MKILRLPGVIIIFIALASLPARAQRFDPADAGSKVHFVIKNFGINTGGDLQGLQGDIYFDTANLAQSFFNTTVAVKTIDTDNSLRDKDLRSEEYFDEKSFPFMRITSTKIGRTNKTEQGYYFFTGQIIIHGVTKNISFPFHAEKVSNDFIFTADFEIKRLDFNIGASSAFLGNNVAVSLKVYAKKK